MLVTNESVLNEANHFNSAFGKLADQIRALCEEAANYRDQSTEYVRRAKETLDAAQKAETTERWEELVLQSKDEVTTALDYHNDYTQADRAIYRLECEIAGLIGKPEPKDN